MLHLCRQEKTIHITIITIAFALMVKMLMPIAHASTMMSGERTGFFAVLCKTSLRIQAEQTIAKANTHHAHHQHHEQGHQHDANQARNTANCPLCLLLEQTFYDSTDLFTAVHFGLSFNDTQFTEYYDLYSSFQSLLSPIRAPPAFL